MLSAHSDLSTLFQGEVACSRAVPSDELRPLFEVEESSLSQPTEVRRREFSAGRAAARRALALLGSKPVAIPQGPDRVPQWPPDIVGSITHCRGFCAAVVGRGALILGLGIDAEGAAPLEPELEALICRKEERRHHSHLPEIEDVHWPKLVFSAKEAFYKCIYPRERQFLDFLDVTVRFAVTGEREGSFETAVLRSGLEPVILTGRVHGRWRIEDGIILTGATWLSG